MSTRIIFTRAAGLVRTILSASLLMFAILALFTSCQKAKQDSILSPNGFDVDKFVQNIRNTYGPQTVGFSYAISASNHIVRHGAMGKARLGTDGNLDYSIETRQELFSVTKLMTAIATFKLLLMKGKTMDEPIVPYLPASWNVHPSYNNLTFRRLLSHNSGFPMNDRGYDSLKLMMSKPQGNTARSYNNANFALCRILLPYLFYQNTGILAALQVQNIEEFTAVEFRKLMRDLVLKPAGLQFWDKADFKDWNHLGQNNFPNTRYYLRSDLSLGSIENSDDVMIAGSRGLVLSTYEVAQVLIAFEDGKLVPNHIRQVMKAEGCGFDGVGGFNGAKGTYYWKNGGGQYSRGQGGESIIMLFPNNVQVSINTNSNRDLDDQFVSLASNIAKAYDEAWIN